MEREQFEQLVQQGVAAIPQEFREKLDNVVLFTELFPTREQRRQINLRRGWTLFGLYEGIPISKRGQNYFGVLPDRITIFQGPIEAAAQGDPVQMAEIVKHTVWHEIAHHFGMSEAEVRAAESKRKSS